MFLLVLLVLLCWGQESVEQEVDYSFRVPAAWGTLALKNAHCCSHGIYATNITNASGYLPDAIGLGVQKGGSTSLAVYLSRHEQYIGSRPKEVHFFDKDVPRKNVKAYQKAWRNRGTDESIRYEFTPSYLWVPFSACRVKKLMPNMKFMVVLRDPADRAFSEFNMVRTRCKGGRTMCSWVHSDFYKYSKKGVMNLEQRRCTFNNGTGEKNWNDCFRCLLYNSKYRRVCQYRPYYFSLDNGKKTCFFFGAQFVSRGLYAAQLAWWFELFPPQNFLIINSHEFFQDSVGQLQRVNEFFGVKQGFKKWMTKSQGMKGKYYKFKDPHKEKALEFLRDFYKRPNRELYKLLDEVQLGPFAPFENWQKTLQATNMNETAPATALASTEAVASAEAPSLNIDRDFLLEDAPNGPLNATKEHHPNAEKDRDEQIEPEAVSRGHSPVPSFSPSSIPLQEDSERVSPVADPSISTEETADEMIQELSSKIDTISSGGTSNKEARHEIEERFEEVVASSSKTEEIERSITFRTSRNSSQGYKSPGIPRGGYLLGLAVLLTAFVIWLARFSRSRQARYSPLSQAAR